MAGAFIAENTYVILRLINRQEKGQPLNVVPVGVSEQQSQLEGLTLEFRHQLTSEQAQTGTGVEDDDLAIGAHFDTGSVAAIVDGARTGSWNGASHAPEFEPGGGGPFGAGFGDWFLCHIKPVDGGHV